MGERPGRMPLCARRGGQRGDGRSALHAERNEHRDGCRSRSPDCCGHIYQGHFGQGDTIARGEGATEGLLMRLSAKSLVRSWLRLLRESLTVQAPPVAILRL